MDGLSAHRGLDEFADSRHVDAKARGRGAIDVDLKLWEGRFLVHRHVRRAGHGAE